MDQVRLNNLRDTLKRTLKKILEEETESALDFRKIHILYDRMVDKCEGDKKMAVEIMTFVTKEIFHEMNIETKNPELWEKLNNLGMFS